MTASLFDQSSSNVKHCNVKHLEGLNSEQLKAVRHLDGPILVLAGAGSGKTRVLTRRIAHLVLEHGVKPDRIMAVTFTNKAAGEMRERLEALMGGVIHRAWVATFHSVALRILRRHAAVLGYKSDFAVYDASDSQNMMGKVIKARGFDVKKHPPSGFLKPVERFKHNFIGPREALERAQGSQESESAEIYGEYQRELLLANAMDFSDLLFNVVRLFEEEADVRALYQDNFRYLLVDEFQDTNPIQYRFLKLLAAKHRNVLVVGDDDQSIYAFRGANPQNMLKFKREFGPVAVVKLEENYRSTQVILDVANSLIANNSERMEKELWTQAKGGELVTTYVASNEREEAQFLLDEIRAYLRVGGSESDIGIFYRTNAQSRALEEALFASGMPYRIYGGLRFYDRKEVKDILGFLRLLINPMDVQALLRVVNTPPRGIGPKSVQTLLEAMSRVDGNSFEALALLKGANRGLDSFQALMLDFRQALTHMSLSDLVGHIVERSGYLQKLNEIKDHTAQSRIENLKELQGLANEVVTWADTAIDQLRFFLDRAALMSSADSTADADSAAGRETISLMTLHLAKGLEFDVVFFTGLEDGLLPHYLSADNPSAVEEERRLAYVGITRARRKLYLTRSRSRMLFGGKQSVRPEERYRKACPFLSEIPSDLLDQRNADIAATFAYEELPGYAMFVPSSLSGSSFKGVRAKSAPKSKSEVLKLLKPADNLGAVTPLEELFVGADVRHPYFGRGVVESIELNQTEAGNSRVRVAFQTLPTSKLLVYRHAKLELIVK